MEDKIKAAADMLAEKQQEIIKLADEHFWNLIQISLADKDGKVIGKISMKYEDMLSLTKIHGIDDNEAVGMLYHALESETKSKLDNLSEDDV